MDEAGGDDVILEVNSPGGYVFAGMEMYNRLKMYSGKITAVVMSIAASAASLITCAADTVQMCPVSQLMTGMEKAEILKLMDVTTWLGPEEAKEKNFADEILFAQEEQPAMAAAGVIMLTSAQVAQLAEAMRAEKTVNRQQKTAALNLLRQKYNYLSLKGEN